MSMENIACSGHVIEANKFLRFFKGEESVEFIRLLEEHDIQGLRDFIGAETSDLGPLDKSHWPNDLPQPEDVFHLTDEDESDNLERGVIYFCFADSELFIKTPTDNMKHLMRNDVEPKYERWTIWG